MKSELPGLSLDDVKVGDVLLSCGRARFSQAIQLLDGGDYSHAAICVGMDSGSEPLIIESTRNGVEENPLKPDITGQKYVDVYRFKSDSGKHFGAARWPSEPVIHRANFYKDQKTRYAFNQLYLMSILIFVRKAPVGKLGKATLRYCLDQMVRFYKKDWNKQKELVTCSEMVYRCFYEADAGPNGKYGLTIRITIAPGGKLIKSITDKSTIADPALDQKTDALLQEAKALFMQTKAGSVNPSQPFRPAQPIVQSKAPNPNVNANLVTPGDLQKSPNLELLGRLRR